jgi:regulator of replication initiation timing
MEDNYYSMCWTCWRGTQGHKRIKSDERYESLQAIIQGLLEEESLPDQQILQLQAQVKQLTSANQRLSLEATNLRIKVQSKPKLDQALIKKMLLFCHPDKNQSRDVEAGELTKILLALREKK